MTESEFRAAKTAAKEAAKRERELRKELAAAKLALAMLQGR